MPSTPQGTEFGRTHDARPGIAARAGNADVRQMSCKMIQDEAPRGRRRRKCFVCCRFIALPQKVRAVAERAQARRLGSIRVDFCSACADSP